MTRFEVPDLSLGTQVAHWIQRKVVVPDRDQAGQPFNLTDPELAFLENMYEVLARSGRFRWARGASLKAPQKWGKAPVSAAIICAEAEGPVLFDHWAEAGEESSWGYCYSAGEPVGRPWATPVIQVTAVSDDQARNVWSALVPMIELGSLKAEIPDTGETRINLATGGKITPVTSSHRSRLGQRITFSVQDQAESWVQSNHGRTLADNQRRNLAGMGGRFLETPNAYDPREGSVAQDTWEGKEPGVYRWAPDAGPGSIRNKRDRARMIRKVYDGHLVSQGGWIDPNRIDAEIVALLPRDPAQAERWFLNRDGGGSESAFDVARWRTLAKPEHEVPQGALVTVGVDGARWDDSLAIIATEVESGYQWVVCLLESPPHPADDYEHDLDEADNAMLNLFETCTVWRAYVDPQRIEKLVERWQSRWGEKRIIEWFTHRDKPVCYAVREYVQAVAAGDVTHDGDPRFEAHIRNARKYYRSVLDEDKRRMYTLSKDAPMSPRKVDAAMGAVLSWEARGDCIAAGAVAGPAESIYETGGFAAL